ncbi:hypothetical protein OP10G_3236 [Fimbriimonas ginsengisoli Gsoil 348]|uniref:Uncharacterized protein n=1 Tax=Fimbriimonas ginsengisoli Gsoil 348 TaxID=661478 RepID=A0A068NY35_FIMGI|nr:hypothetical protein OP10G_3236 [Fimbriimonas ginsengisoli Gsoil 348]
MGEIPAATSQRFHVRGKDYGRCLLAQCAFGVLLSMDGVVVTG